VLAVRDPHALASREASQQRERGVEDERREHHHGKPRGPRGSHPSEGAERAGEESQRDRAGVAHEDARRWPVHREEGLPRPQIEQSLHDGLSDKLVVDLAEPATVVAYPDETLRTVVQRMAETGFTRFPVVERGTDRKLVGMISLTDLLEGRRQNLDAERRRERVLSLRLAFPRRMRGAEKEKEKEVGAA